MSETVCGLKRALQARSGTSRFQQRLLLGGDALGEDTELGGLGPRLHLSLVMAPYVELVHESVHGAIPRGATFHFRDVISDDDVDALEHLLRAPADPNLGLEWAAFYAHDEAMRLLLDAAADPNYEI